MRFIPGARRLRKLKPRYGWVLESACVGCQRSPQPFKNMPPHQFHGFARTARRHFVKAKKEEENSNWYYAMSSMTSVWGGWWFWKRTGDQLISITVIVLHQHNSDWCASLHRPWAFLHGMPHLKSRARTSSSMTIDLKTEIKQWYHLASQFEVKVWYRMLCSLSGLESNMHGWSDSDTMRLQAMTDKLRELQSLGEKKTFASGGVLWIIVL